MDSNPTSTARQDPYSSLLMTLMPGAKGFGLYEASGQHRWIQSDNQMTGMTLECSLVEWRQGSLKKDVVDWASKSVVKLL